jgi:uncharacterized protein (DUF2336 family)
VKSFFTKLIRGAVLPKELSYEQTRDALETHSLQVRRELAKREDAEPEMLYYLAADDVAEVRRSVAANPATPQQAFKLLAHDADDSVRCELAQKIGRLVPGLDPGEQSRVRDLAIEVLETLAQDHLPRVRQIIAEEIKSTRNVPLHIVKKLARDLEAIVAAPILEYSPLLSDEDLVEIVAGGSAKGALEAVARRRGLTESVADAVVATLDVPAVAALLANASAQIREDTLDRIISSAESIEAWHKPLVLRPELSLRAVRRIAGFVAFSLLEILQKRTDLDEDTSSELRGRVRTRIAHENLAQETIDRARIASEQVAEAKANGELNDDFVQDAAERSDREVVVHSLAMLAEVPAFVVERVLAAKSGKAIIALCWKARLAMRVCLKIQSNILRLQARDLVLPRNGVDYPLTQEEMGWHLGFFGITN